MSDWKAPALDGLSGSLLGISICFVALRFTARLRQKADLRADDWVMLVALIMFLGLCITVFLGVRFKAVGISSYSMSAAEDLALDPIAYKTTLPGDLFSYITLGCTKSSALLFYKRIFYVPGHGNQLLRWLINISIVVVTLWVVAFSLLAGLQCGTHFTALWSLQNHNKYCLYTYTSIDGLTISDVILDVWVLALPLPWIWQLHLTLIKKFGVAGLFLLALVSLVASIIRLAVWIPITEAGQAVNEKLDPRQIDSRLSFYYVLECGMSIIAINMPIVAFLLFRVAPHFAWTKARSWASSVTTLGSRGGGHRGAGYSTTAATVSSTHRSGSHQTLSFDEQEKEERGCARSGEREVPLLAENGYSKDPSGAPLTQEFYEESV